MLLSSDVRFLLRSGSESVNLTDLTARAGEPDRGIVMLTKSGLAGREADSDAVVKGLAGRDCANGLGSGLGSNGLVGSGNAGEPGKGGVASCMPYNDGLVHVGYNAKGLAG